MLTHMIGLRFILLNRKKVTFRKMLWSEYNMMNAVDKYSTDIIADNEMIIAVDDVVKKDYDSAVVRIKKALARLESLATAEIIRSRDLKAMVYSNIGSSYSKMGRDKEAQRYFNDARDEYDSSSEKSEECHKSWVMFDYINHAINDRYVALS